MRTVQIDYDGTDYGLCSDYVHHILLRKKEEHQRYKDTQMEEYQEKVLRVLEACPMESLTDVQEALRRANGLVIRAINLLNVARCSTAPTKSSTFSMSAESADVPFKESSVINFAPGNGRIFITKPGMNHPLFETRCMFKLRSQDGAIHTYQLVAYLGDGVYVFFFSHSVFTHLVS